jgi:FkbM family methyltransferase
MKDLIRAMLNSVVYTAAKRHVVNDILFSCILDSALSPSCSNLCHIPTVVQIGANDGVTNDPIFQWLKKKSGSFRAIMVEPQSDVFEKLKKNYTWCDSIDFVRAAVCAEANVRMYRIARSKTELYRKIYKRHANPSGITSFNKEHVLAFLRRINPDYFKRNDIDEWIESFRAETISFDDLLRRRNIAKIDLLQIDAEGYDGAIVKMALKSLSRENLRVINFEYKAMPVQEVAMIKQLLIKKGYSVYLHCGDMTAFNGVEIEL